MEGSFTLQTTSQSFSTSWPNGSHAWFVVLYPRAGWVFCEPQEDFNTVSVQHYLEPTVFDAQQNPLRGISFADPDYAYSVDRIGHFSTLDGSWIPMIAATVSHNSPVPQPQGAQAHVEICSDKGTGDVFSPEGTTYMRAWVSGSSSIVWCTIDIDGKVLAEGPPASVLKRRDLGSGGYGPGMHVISLAAEDVSGIVFRSEKQFAVDWGSLSVRALDETHVQLVLRTPLASYKYLLQRSTDLTKWTAEGDWFSGTGEIATTRTVTIIKDSTVMWRLLVLY